MKKIILICLLTLLITAAQAQNTKTMKETKNVASMGPNPVTLLGEPAVVGAVAPEFTAVNAQGKDVKLSDFKDKIVVLSVFPSIDTKICAMQARHFNADASALGNDVVILTLSKDLPFALGRFCAAEGIDRVITLSDYKQSEFGTNYGFLIKENMLLSRGVVIVGKDGKIKYAEYVPQIASEPDYQAALEAIKTLR